MAPTTRRRARDAVAAAGGGPDTVAAAPAGGDPGDAVAARYNLDGAPSSSGSAGMLTLPTILTLLRVAAIPVLFVAYFWPAPWAPAVCGGIFVGASLTDWLDGYLARVLNASSAFGAFLDPVADKLMVAAALILLCTTPPNAAGAQWLLPLATTAIIGREITMSALREWAAAAGGDAHKAVAVNSLGKWKTATQMASITLLLTFRDGGSGIVAQTSLWLGPALLVVASVLALWSLGVYFAAVFRFMR